ncbi:Helix-turn-helix domain-containing protein [Candidatus Thermokryptus mobilis]|uniref:Helix-turn-helix domain-containing protein n=1 Tax=Candidatus Thermokryptus mobilis TaxID=1643428 RepID=A0A0S4N958_9BACT|nr:Helix-turn-helix domain-containing protein [Candidatus Thermokryptus mobilis]
MIETYRIDRVIDLIASGVKVKDVFKKCGYRQARTFRGAFKRRLKISPMEFKRELNNCVREEKLNYGGNYEELYLAFSFVLLFFCFKFIH